MLAASHHRAWVVALATVAIVAAGESAASGIEACPASGAALTLQIDAMAVAVPAAVELTGTRLAPSCDASAELLASYRTALSCDPSQPATCHADVSSLAPGLWSHAVTISGVAGEPQRQWRRSFLLDRSAGTHALTWRVFASVFTVTSATDSLGCTDCLRAALNHAATATPPALIQFAPALSGTIGSVARLPPLAVDDVTLDALAPNGEPWRRTVDGGGRDEPAFTITGGHNTIVGLRVTNAGGNTDVVLIDGATANGNLLDEVQVTGRALVTCGQHLDGCLLGGECHTPETDPPEGICGDDGIAVRGGAGVSAANVVRRSDISGAFDKAVKVSDLGVVRVEDCHIHDNRDGGIQATLSGSAQAVRNLIENNRGTNSASGLAANGNSTASPLVPGTLVTDGNISRNNALRGISVRSLSQATLSNDFVCGNGVPGRGSGFGVAIAEVLSQPPVVIASGLTSAYNTDGGVNVTGQSRVDFGTTERPGNNAFTANGTADATLNFANFSFTAINAMQSQWEHCGIRPFCNDAAIVAGDTAGDVLIAPSLAHRRRHPPRIDSIVPSFGAAGDLVRIYGSGFDVIDALPRGGTCDAIAAANRCLPQQGNCVTMGKLEAEVVAVTPTLVTIRLPANCVAPTTISVRIRGAPSRGQVPFCILTADRSGHAARRP